MRDLPPRSHLESVSQRPILVSTFVTVWLAALFVALKRTRALVLALLVALSLGHAGSAKAAPFVLATNTQHGTVSVIDAASNTVATTIPIAASDLLGIAVAPNGSFAYVGGFSGTVWVIDTAAGVVTDAIPVGWGPRAFVFTRDGALAYVVDQFRNAVWVIDTASRHVVGDPILLPDNIAGNATSIAIAPDDSRLYVVKNNGDGNQSTLSFVDTSAKVVIDTIPVGSYSSDLALSPDGTLAYVVNQVPGTLSVISTSARTVIDTIATGPAQFVRITRDGQLAYLSGGGNVSIFKLSTRQRVGSPIPVPYASVPVLSADERFVYVSSSSQGGSACPVGSQLFCGSVSVIDAATRMVVTTILTGRSWNWLAIAPTLTLVPPPACADNVDNDGDGAFDWGVVALSPWPAPGYGDPGCDSPFDASERSAALVCDDGIDNDGDGLTDYPTDPGCGSPSANVEDPTCENGVDDDGDGLADFPADPACTSPIGESEKNPALPCDDGYDNDSDGFTDYPADLDCRSSTDGIEETDVDSDGVGPQDNCALVPNPSQLDSDRDGYGNACDADYDNDGMVGISDFAIFKSAFGRSIGDPAYNPNVDTTSDGSIGFAEFGFFKRSLGREPGPSGRSCVVIGDCYCELTGYCGGGF